MEQTPEQLPLEGLGEQVHENIDDAKGKKRESKRGNDLDGATWTKYSISVWSDIRKSQEEIELGHPAIFPSQLVKRLIECFTKSEERVVLDPFCGSGSTAVTASRMDRVGIGFEVSPDYVELANTRLQTRELWNPEPDEESVIYPYDARHMDQYLDPNSVDLVITSPPYWDILSQKRTADGKAIRDYGDAVEDLGKIDDYQAFLDELTQVFIQVYGVLRPGKYCVVVVMDLRKRNRFFPLHADVADMMQDVGFVYDDLIIWDRRHEYNNLRPLGYPAVFRINKCHEYLLIFQKPQE